MNCKPLVSICIPNYNNAEYVEEAIQSALNQTYQNIEVVVVDNCSTDNSWEVISKFKQNSQIRIFQNKSNLGMIGNFRESLKHAKGKYISFLCSDDLIDDNTVEILLEKIELSQNCSFVFGNVRYIGERKGQSNFKFPEYSNSGAWFRKSLRKGGNMAYLAGTIFRRLDECPEQTIVDLTFFDWYLWLRLSKNNCVCFENQCVATHRYHINNETKIQTPDFASNMQGLKKVVELAYNNNIINQVIYERSCDRISFKFFVNQMSVTDINDLKIYKITSMFNNLLNQRVFNKNRLLMWFVMFVLRSSLGKFYQIVKGNYKKSINI